MTRKKKKGMGLWIMLGMIVVLGGIYLAVNAIQTQKEQEEQAATQKIYLYQSLASKVQKVRVTNEHMDLKLVRQEDRTWKIEGQDDFPVNDDRVDYWASSLANFIVEKKVADQIEDLTMYGLDQPTLTIEVDGEAGPAKLVMGGRSALTDSFYMQKEGDPALYAVGSGYYYTFNRTLAQMMAVEEVDRLTNVQHVIVTRKDQPTLEFAYNAIGDGVILQPYAAAQPMSEAQVEALVQAYDDYKFDASEGYAEELNLADYGLADPMAEITVTYQPDGETQTSQLKLSIGDTNEEGDYYALLHNSGRVYVVTDKNVAGFVGFETIQYVRPEVCTEEELAGVITTADGNILGEDVKQVLAQVVLERDLPAGAEVSGEAVLTLKVGENRELAFYPYDGANFYRLEENGQSFFVVGLREVDAVMAAMNK